MRWFHPPREESRGAYRKGTADEEHCQKRELSLAREVRVDLVVLGVGLRPAARVADRGDPEAIEPSREEARGVDLFFVGQGRSLRERRVQDGGIGLSQEKPRELAARVADKLRTGGIRRVLGIADLFERGSVQEGEMVEMNEDRCIRGNRIEVVEATTADDVKMAIMQARNDRVLCAVLHQSRG